MSDCKLDETGRTGFNGWLNRRDHTECYCGHLRTSHFGPDADGIEKCAFCDCDCFACDGWRAFLIDGVLVEHVQRTGPDAVNAAQRCGCAECRGG